MSQIKEFPLSLLGIARMLAMVTQPALAKVLDACYLVLTGPVLSARSAGPLVAKTLSGFAQSAIITDVV